MAKHRVAATVSVVALGAMELAGVTVVMLVIPTVLGVLAARRCPQLQACNGKTQGLELERAFTLAKSLSFLRLDLHRKTLRYRKAFDAFLTMERKVGEIYTHALQNQERQNQVASIELRN